MTTQFDVHALANGNWVVNVQSDLISTFGTKVIVPLIRPDEDATPVGRLNPLVRVLEEDRLLATHLTGAIPRSQLGPTIASLADEEYTIKGAIDMLFSGF